MEKSYKYITYRDIHHCLLYGGANHLQALIVRWDISGDDYTTDVAREFFQLDPTTPLQIVKLTVNNFSATTDFS